MIWIVYKNTRGETRLIGTTKKLDVILSPSKRNSLISKDWEILSIGVGDIFKDKYKIKYKELLKYDT